MAKRRSVPLPSFAEAILDAALDRAIALQRPLIVAYLDRYRGRRRSVTPVQVTRLLERRYLGVVTAIGAAAGGAAAVPGVGTAASVASAALEITAFVEATAVFGLAMAEVHGLRIDDPQVRHALVLALLLGDAGVEAAELAAANAGSQWGKVLSRRASEETIQRVNHVLSRHVLTRFGAKQGALMVGRALPLGIGASIGAVGNAALGRGVVTAARRMFGPPPDSLPPRVIDAQVSEPDPAPPPHELA